MVISLKSRQVTMYFLLVSLIYLTTAQISVKGVSERGFFIQVDEANKLRGDRVYWVAHTTKETLSVKQLMNGVSSLGVGCSGVVTQKQLQTRPTFEVQCKLEFGKPYTLEAVVTKSGEDHQILTADFDFSDQRRRLLNTPSAMPVTAAPTTAPVVSAMPSRSPVTSAPTSDGVTHNPSAYPSSVPSSTPSVASSSSTTTEATIPVLTTSLQKEEDDGSKFAGFDLSSGGGVSLFVFAILLLIAALGLILGGPYLYRRYYETFGSKTVGASPKEAAKLSNLSKSKLAGSSFRSESKIEIAPIRSEDRIRLADPVE